MSENNKSENKEKQGFWLTVASFIVNKRKAIEILFIVAAVYCVFNMNRVRVNQDITSYLPSTSETRIGLTTMEDQFITYGSGRVMVSNITYGEAEYLKEKIEKIPGVKGVAFDDSKDHFSGSNALFDVTVEGTEDEEKSIRAMNQVEEMLSGYDVYVSSSVGAVEKSMASLSKDMNMILVLSVLIIVLVLIISTKAFMEIPVLLITFGSAALLNKGTNFWFGEISSVTNSIAVVLQLALAIDYAIILCDRYMEEHEKLEPVEACKVALSKAIPEISSSSLTTVSGMAAMMFMQFRLGFDMGIVLVKAIIFSLIAVFFLMPGVILIFAKGIDKTMHKSFVPKISFVGKFAAFTKYVIPPIFVLVIIGAFYSSSNCQYLYDVDSVPSARLSEAKIASNKIKDTFGSVNQLVVMVPVGDYEKEALLAYALEEQEYVSTVTALSNQKVNDDYTVTDKLTPRQFSELAGLDIEIARVLYAAYAYNIEQYGPVVTGIDDYAVPLIDMFLFLYEQYSEGYVTLSDELDDTLNELYDKLHDGELQLKGDEYSRMVLNFEMPVEGEETYEKMENIRDIAARYYDKNQIILVGNSTSCNDLASSFATDNIIISVLTALFVLIILFFTFQSAGLPVLLVLTIQGSIWINFSVPAFEGMGVYFIAYLIVSAIQMGATIDYAIVISSRYLQLKTEMPIKDAITETLNQAFPTIFTSGTILTCAGFLIGEICSDATVAAIGVALGRGTLISIILVLFVLPQILLLGDVIIEKTALSVKLGGEQVNMLGRIVVSGRIKGEFHGQIDAEVKGILNGNLDGSVSTLLPGRYVDMEMQKPTLQMLPMGNNFEEENVDKESESSNKEGNKETVDRPTVDKGTGNNGTVDKGKDNIEAGNKEKKEKVDRNQKNKKKVKKNFFGRFGKGLSVLIFALSLSGIVSYQAYASELEDEVIVNEPIIIDSIEAFVDFARGCQFDAYSVGQTFELTADLNLTGAYVDDEIFSGVPYFDGTFNGNSHTISGVRIMSKGSNQGFFRYIGPNATVKNLNIHGFVNVSGTAENVGGIAGSNAGTIINCDFTGSVNANASTGGIAGINKSTGTVYKCTNNGLILATNITGGIVGNNEGMVQRSVNRGEVNVKEYEATLDLGGVDLGTLNITQNIATRNDMGGIAGFSKGIISECLNYASVGFSHSGYNVGGIAGRQSGIIINSHNHGNIKGRKDVGGIVGQAEPFVESEYLSDKVDETKNQVDELNNTLTGINSTLSYTSSQSAKYASNIADTTTSSFDSISDDLRELTDKVNEEYPDAKEYTDNINEALDNISNIESSGTLSSNYKEVQDNLKVISSNLSSIQNSFDGTGKETKELAESISDELKKTSQYDDTDKLIKTLNNGVQSITNSLNKAADQIEGIRDTVSDSFSVITGEEQYITDISSLETAALLDGVISGCTNDGKIEADINVGGIVGTMNIEYSQDPEFDIDFTSNLSIVMRSTVNDVIVECINKGTVSAKKDCAGGICGLSSLGLIGKSEGYGNIKSDGNSIGGIVGESSGAVIQCYVLCTVSGLDYIGGISGKASSVKDCIAVPVLVSEGREAIGAIIGWLDDITASENNFYYCEDYEGIDNISYLGISESLSYDEICDRFEVPEGFETVTVYFMCDDSPVKVKNIPYGGSIVEDDFPVLSEKDGCYIRWNTDKSLDNVTENLEISAEYINFTTAVAGEAKYDGKNIFLVVDNFKSDASLYMSECSIPDMCIMENGSLLYAYDWKLETDEDWNGEFVEGHFFVPAGYDSVELLVSDNSAWCKTDVVIDGSYVTAKVPVNASFAMVGYKKTGPDMMIVYGLVGGAILLFTIFIIIKATLKKSKKSSAS